MGAKKQNSVARTQNTAETPKICAQIKITQKRRENQIFYTKTKTYSVNTISPPELIELPARKVEDQRLFLALKLLCVESR